MYAPLLPCSQLHPRRASNQPPTITTKIFLHLALTGAGLLLPDLHSDTLFDCTWSESEDSLYVSAFGDDKIRAW